MGKEVKIGLAVIGALLCVFGGVLAYRLKGEQPTNALEKVAAAEQEGRVKGRKKRGEKPGKKDKDKDEKPASLADRFQELKGATADDDNGPKTDRYGRPLDDDGSLNSADGAANGELAGGEAPDLQESAYGNRRRADRPSRYQPGEGADEAQAEVARLLSDRSSRYQRDEPLPPDEGAELTNEGAADDLAMPDDRFAQPTGGVSFSDVEPADEATEPSEVEEERGDAPRFSMGGRPDRFAGEERESAPDSEVTDDVNEDGAGVTLAPVPQDDEGEMTPAENDRFRRRYGDVQPLADDSSLNPDEMIDQADHTPSDVEERPRRLREPQDDSYTVEPNDNFWRISQKVYGTGAYFKALEEHNRRQFGDRPLINVGDAVSTPPISVLQQDYPDLTPKPRNVPAERRNTALASRSARGGRTYTVAEGDTLFDIARAELGKASRWAEIYDLNRDQLGEDFNYLSPGMQLALPSRGDKSEPIATRPSRDAFRR
ncbi:MAG TPA: LysM peptidoglycan-binding domain-containing protein [Pirellulales bacterium]|nr:LysM peptidoglycan-binding domain-containing protein [Pirellulales bacterium]